MNILSDLSLWSFIISFLVGAVYTALLYGKKLKRRENRKPLFIGLASLCWLSVSLLCFLLFSPIVRRDILRTEKPIVLLLQDDSRSIAANHDSTFMKKEYPILLQKQLSALGKNFDVQTYFFSENTVEAPFSKEFSYTGKLTNISQALTSIKELYYQQNLGAVVLATDGIVNYGSNPLSITSDLSFPIYSLALGDTAQKKDVRINAVFYNKITYLGNTFPIECVFSADKYKGSVVLVKVKKAGKLLYSKQFTIESDQFEFSETFSLEAKEVGLNAYEIELSPLEGESTYENNTRKIWIEVLDQKMKIALISAFPHPDVAALYQMLTKSKHYEVESFLLKDFNKNLSQYNLVVLNQIPSMGQGKNLIEEASRINMPILFLLGLETDFESLNSLNKGLKFRSNINKMNENQAVINPTFSLFTLDEAIKTAIQQYPPLLSRFGNYELDQAAQILAFSKIGNITSKQALIALVQNAQSRTAFICGEGVWKWRLAEYQQRESFEYFDQLLGKVVQYLMTNQNKKRFWVDYEKMVNENTPIHFKAELYNENYELVNTPDVVLQIIDSAKKVTEYVLQKNQSRYSLSIGSLPKGNYRFKASVSQEGAPLTQEGSFVVEEVNLEMILTKADHPMLYSLAQRTGGEFFDLSTLDQLAEKIRQREDMKPVVYSQKEYADLLSYPLVFILILILLSVHWFLRKYHALI